MIIKSSNENIVTKLEEIIELEKHVTELTIIGLEFENKIIKNYVLKSLEQVEQTNDIKNCLEIANKAKHRVKNLLKNKHIIDKLSISDIINQLSDIEKEVTIDIFNTYQNFVELYKEECSLSNELYFITPGEFLEYKIDLINHLNEFNEKMEG